MDIADWVVADERKKFTITSEDYFDTEIPAGGYFLLYREVTGIALNNSGQESVFLYNPAGEKVDEVKMDVAKRTGQSYALNSAKRYQWTTLVTPGAANNIEIPGGGTVSKNKTKETAQNETKKVLLPDIRAQSLGEQVETSGIVAVEPGILGDGVIYLAGSGIRVSFTDLAVPQLAAGAEIKLTGTLRTYHGELELLVAEGEQIEILASGPPPDPHETKTGEVNAKTEGQLVALSGLITDNQGDAFFLDDGTGAARIYLRDSAQIIKPKIRKGDYLKVVGLVSQYDGSFRVLPRYQSDLEQVSTLPNSQKVAGAATEAGNSQLPRTGLDFWLIIAILGTICYITLVVFPIYKGKTCQKKEETL